MESSGRKQYRSIILGRRCTPRQFLLPVFLLFLLVLVIVVGINVPNPARLADQVGMKHIGLELSNKDIYKINRRIHATDQSLKDDRLDKYVVGRLQINGKDFPVEVRNRGSFGYHKNFERKSWRFKSPFNQMIFPGIARFNISRSRYPHFEDHLAYTVARQIHQPAPASSPLLFSFNGDWHGVYHFTEQTDDFFLRRQKLPYGPIYGDYKRNDRDVTTAETVRGRSGKSKVISPWTNGFSDIRNTFWHYLSMREREKTGKAEPLNDLLKYLYLDDAQFESQTFDKLDLESCLRWHALQIMLGSAHSDIHNLRLFYNPEKNGFQLFTWDPLPFQDYVAHRNMPGWWVPMGNKLLLRLNEIPEYDEVRNRYTWKLLNREFTEHDLLKLIDGLYPRLRQIYKQDSSKAYLVPMARKRSSNRRFSLEEFDQYHRTLKEWIRDRYRYLGNYLNSQKGQGLYRSLGDGLFQIILENKADTGALLEEIALERGVGDPERYRLYFDANHNNHIDAEEPQLPLKMVKATKQRLRFVLVDPFIMLTEKRLIGQNQAGKGLVEYETEDGITEMLVGNVQQPVPVPTYFSFLLQTGTESKEPPALKIGIRNSSTQTFRRIDARKFAKVSNADRLSWGKDRRTSLLRWVRAGFPEKKEPEHLNWSGQITVEKTFTVESSQTLHVMPGTVVRFSPGASLMVFGHIEALGTEEKEILFTGKEKWGVIAINNGEGRFKNVAIENGGDATIRHIPYSGALSAYNSKIQVQNTVVRRSGGDDGINVKYGEAEISASLFEANVDGIDCDFSTCTITESTFIRNRNDAIDIGSSFTTVKGNMISGSGDKGISIGGYSKVAIEKSQILDNQIGLAVKDGSQVALSTSSILSNTVGAVLFVKNKDYKLSVPQMEFVSGEIRDNDLNLWQQENTVLLSLGGHIAPDKRQRDEIGFDWKKLYQ